MILGRLLGLGLAPPAAGRAVIPVSERRAGEQLLGLTCESSPGWHHDRRTLYPRTLTFVPAWMASILREPRLKPYPGALRFRTRLRTGVHSARPVAARCARRSRDVSEPRSVLTRTRRRCLTRLADTARMYWDAAGLVARHATSPPPTFMLSILQGRTSRVSNSMDSCPSQSLLADGCLGGYRWEACGGSDGERDGSIGGPPNRTSCGWARKRCAVCLRGDGKSGTHLTDMLATLHLARMAISGRCVYQPPPIGSRPLSVNAVCA